MAVCFWLRFYFGGGLSVSSKMFSLSLLPSIINPEPLVRVHSDIFLNNCRISSGYGVSVLSGVATEIVFKLRFNKNMMRVVFLTHNKDW